MNPFLARIPRPGGVDAEALHVVIQGRSRDAEQFRRVRLISSGLSEHTENDAPFDGFPDGFERLSDLVVDRVRQDLDKFLSPKASAVPSPIRVPGLRSFMTAAKPDAV